DEGPLDRPDATLGGRDAGVYGAMGMAVVMALVVVCHASNSSEFVTSVGSISTYASARTLPSGSLEVDSCRSELSGAPVLGLMQTVRPVLCGGQVDRLRIQAKLPDACLGELQGMGIVRFDGAFNDHRLLLGRPIVALGRPLVTVCRGCCRDVLPDIGQRRLVQRDRQVGQKQTK